MKRTLIGENAAKSSSKRQKRFFQKTWESDFFVVGKNNKAICLVENCLTQLGFMKSSIEKHFNSKHKDFIKKMEGLSPDQLDHFKIEKFSEFKTAFEEKNCFSQIQNIDKHKLASHQVAFLIAKHLKYFF